MYAKVFAQILDSSIAENWQIRHVFMDLLVLADPDGVVDMTVEAIARRTNVPLDIIKAAISELSTPDAKSRTQDEDGRRIVLLDDHREWGWQIVNYTKFRAIQDKDMQRAYNTAYQRRRRARLAEDAKAHDKPEQTPDSVNVVKDGHGQSIHTEAEAEADTKAQKKKQRIGPEPKTDSASEPSIPPELTGLELYETDKKLLKAWPRFIVAAKIAYPGLDIPVKIKELHAWEIANPQRQKRNRVRFFNNCLARDQDKARPPLEALARAKPKEAKKLITYWEGQENA